MELDTYDVRSWRDAEANAARWLRHWGYGDAVARPEGQDGDVDVRATGALGKVTFQITTVDKSALYKLVDAGTPGSDNQLFYFAAANYAWRAIPYADERHIALFVFAPDGAMTAVNSVAKLVKTRYAGAPDDSAVETATSSTAETAKSSGTTRRWKPWARR